jgi:hypothetical protein
MPDHSEPSDGGIRSPFLDALSAFEARIDTSDAVPDVPFAEPWFNHDTASIGLLVGRDTVIEVHARPAGREVLAGRFSGERRRPINAKGVARAFGITIPQSERMLDHLAEALQAGTTAYRHTERVLLFDDPDEPAETPATPSAGQAAVEEAPDSRHQAIQNQLHAAPQPRPHQTGPRQTSTPIPGPRRPDTPRQPPGLSF